MSAIDTVPGFHPGEPNEGPVPMRGVSSQAGLAAVKYGRVAPADEFQPGARVAWSTGKGRPGTVQPRDTWRHADDLERYPNDVVVQWDGGLTSLVSRGALQLAASQEVAR